MKKYLLRIIACAVLLALAIFLPLSKPWMSLIIFIAAYLTAGADVLFSAVRKLFSGSLLDEEFLMSIASLGAFAIGEYPEAVAVMLLFQIGEMFQSRAVGKSRSSIAQLMDLRPEFANLIVDGEIVQTAPESLLPGQTIIIRPGERVPVDCRLQQGSGSLDTSALTGESLPRDVREGDEIISGCVSMNALLTCTVQKKYSESMVSRILDMVENSAAKKARTEKFITRFARWYTPAVVIAAVLLAVIPPLLGLGAFSEWLYRALTLLVISCPCALVISVPLGFFAGIGGASKRGILIKGSNYLEALARTELAVFDKTGTLTKGRFGVSGIFPAGGYGKEQLLQVAAQAEYYSPHPIARALVEAFETGGGAIEREQISSTEELPGLGLKTDVAGQVVLAGNIRLMQEQGIDCPFVESLGSIVYVAVDKKYAGYIQVEDMVKDSAKEAIASLRQRGIRTVMLSGDRLPTAEKVAEELGIDRVFAQLMPADKVERAEELLKEKSQLGRLAYIGDGINDAPVLARADVGIAMGQLGSDAAIEAADIVIMNDDLQLVDKAICVSRRTMSIVKQNIIFALGIKAVVLVLGIFGLVSMWTAVFADVGVALLAIANSMRALA